MTQKTYTDLREENQMLTELRLVRAGAALFFASQVKKEGSQLEARIKEAKLSFTKIKTEKDDAKKIDNMATGLDAICDALISQRKMLGNITGIAVSSALTTERSNKEITKLVKGGKRR
jgi:hypothetical protein